MQHFVMVLLLILYTGTSSSAMHSIELGNIRGIVGDEGKRESTISDATPHRYDTSAFQFTPVSDNQIPVYQQASQTTSNLAVDLKPEDNHAATYLAQKPSSPLHESQANAGGSQTQNYFVPGASHSNSATKLDYSQYSDAVGLISTTPPASFDTSNGFNSVYPKVPERQNPTASSSPAALFHFSKPSASNEYPTFKFSISTPQQQASSLGYASPSSETNLPEPLTLIKPSYQHSATSSYGSPTLDRVGDFAVQTANVQFATSTVVPQQSHLHPESASISSSNHSPIGQTIPTRPPGGSEYYHLTQSLSYQLPSSYYTSLTSGTQPEEQMQVDDFYVPPANTPELFGAAYQASAGTSFGRPTQVNHSHEQQSTKRSF